MSKYKSDIIHDYNVVLIYLTDDIHNGSITLINNLKDKQPKDGNILTEVQLLQYKGKILEGYDSVKLLDLIRMYCDDFYSSSVYIFGEDNHYDNVKKVFESNSNFLKSDCLVKFIKSNPNRIEEMAITLHEKLNK